MNPMNPRTKVEIVAAIRTRSPFDAIEAFKTFMSSCLGGGCWSSMDFKAEEVPVALFAQLLIIIILFALINQRPSVIVTF